MFSGMELHHWATPLPPVTLRAAADVGICARSSRRALCLGWEVLLCGLGSSLPHNLGGTVLASLLRTHWSLWAADQRLASMWGPCGLALAGFDPAASISQVRPRFVCLT